MPDSRLDYETPRLRREAPPQETRPSAARYALAVFWGAIAVVTMGGLFAGALLGTVGAEPGSPLFAGIITVAFWIGSLLGFVVYQTTLTEQHELE